MPVVFADLAQTCAPTIEVATLAGVASVESGLSPLAIRINTDYPLTKQPGSKAEAIEIAASMIAEGHSLDLGLGGINSSALSRLGLSVSEAFDACINIRATATLLDGYYSVALQAGATPATAKVAMLRSFYGQGDASVGEMVGYDRRVMDEGQRLSPKITTLTLAATPPAQLPAREFTGSAAKSGGGDATSSAPQQSAAASGKSAPGAAIPHWDVFGSGRTSSVLVFSKQQKE